MPTAEQWNWVFLAYAFTYLVLVVFVASLAVRINTARRRLDGDE
jgi:CcmD family protein